MAKLSSRQRRKLPRGDFAGPGRSYPIPDKAHARAALSRASHAVKTGRLSRAAYARIVKRADAKLGKRKQGRGPRASARKSRR